MKGSRQNPSKHFLSSMWSRSLNFI